MKSNILIIGNTLHVNIIRSLVYAVNKARNQFLDIPKIEVIQRSHGALNMVTYLTKAMNMLLKNRYNTLHIIYPAHRLSLKLAEIALHRGVKVIFHWIGTDILLARKRNYLKTKRYIFKQSINIVDTPWFINELEKYDIHVDALIPLLPIDIDEKIKKEMTKWPNVFSLVYYLPKGKELFYNINALIKLSKEFPEINFLVLGKGRLPFKKNNIVEMGFVPRSKIPEVYSKCVGLVRLPQRDGLSIMVLEMLLMQRYVVYNHPFNIPCVYVIHDLPEAFKVISNLLKDFRKGYLRPNKACREVVLSAYNPIKLGIKLLELWSEKH